ncbi:hypothetical protein HOLleu_20046 [Holothuria leucospilota]|uniref:Kazal-like domain-containing protein n=1 Tax=Holothuria leucospilota TaxID=206669 RepID=A0A9Q1C0Y7_HOLLE|nr:hypothetical protein HOLleu_20046 [Holothuria leucospilota]
MGIKITIATLMVVFFVTVHHASPLPSWRLCGLFCSADYSPVCGKLPNGELELFPNRCELLRAVCRGRAEYTDDKGCGLQFLSEDAEYHGFSASA